jgi:putative hydrolases of HD superfamily
MLCEKSLTQKTSTHNGLKSTIGLTKYDNDTKIRTGWIRQDAGPQIESVADHSWRITVMAMIAASSSNSSLNKDEEGSYDTNKCIKMALIHDLAEATVGDITPFCGISDTEKHSQELAAMKELTSKLSPLGLGDTVVAGGVTDDGSTNSVGEEILNLWEEYEAGQTLEAKLVKDMDKLEMILQALEYEQDGKNGKSLDGFFDGTRDNWRTPIGQAWGKEIEARRQHSANQQRLT